MCPDNGLVLMISENRQVLVGGMPVVTQKDMFVIAGCKFALSTPPHPCVTIKWLIPSSRVKVNGNPVILRDSTGQCQSPAQTPQGSPIVMMQQNRVKGM